MEEDAEAVHLDQAEEGGAAGISGEDGGGCAQAGAEDGEESEDLAATSEWLQEHQQDAEAASDGFGQDADQVVGSGDHGRRPAFAGELVERSCWDEGTSKSRSLAALGMTIFAVAVTGAGCDVVDEVRPPRSAAATVACSLRRGADGVCASWGKFRCIWSRTFWEGAAKRDRKST